MRHQLDMLSDGNPNITIFRTSRARQVTYNPAERNTEPVIRPRCRSGKRLFAVPVGIVVILGFLLFWQQTVVPWWSNSIADQWTYGSARVTQMDANVGHGGTSHFLAEYYHNELVVIEMSLSNPNDFHTYALTGLVGATSTPVILLSVEDLNHDGKPDLIIQIQGSTFTTILYNTGSVFSESEG